MTPEQLNSAFVEVTDKTGNSVSICDPAELRFWQPVPDDTDGKEETA